MKRRRRLKRDNDCRRRRDKRIGALPRRSDAPLSRRARSFALGALFAFTLIGVSDVQAVEPAVLDLGVGFGGAGSTDSQVPVWLYANRSGRLLDTQYQGYGAVDFTYNQAYTPFWRGEVSFELQRTISDDEDMLLRLPKGYGAIYGGPFVLHAGRYPLLLGEVSMPELSSGSFSVSNNAFPIPRITGRTDGFVDLPWLDGVVQTKFGLSHGWFEEDRSTANALLHEKWLYLRLQHDQKMSVWGGLVHQAMWGGTTPNEGPVPVSLDNYLRVFTGRSGGGDASTSDQINGAGDTFGIWDIGFSSDVRGATLTGYYQHFYEGLSNFRIWSNGLDGLKGLTLELPHTIPVVPTRLLYERVRTDYQGGPLHDAQGFNLFGRAFYFQNSAYYSGWTYLGQIVGPALLLTDGEGEDLRFVSNRIKANHFGLAGRISQHFEYRIRYSMTRHRFPSYSYETLYSDGSFWQYDGSFELVATQPFGVETLEVSIGGAVTNGDIFDTAFAGFMTVRIDLY